MSKKKKILKSIESFEKQIKKHEKKIEDYEGSNEFIRDYWKKEIELRKKDIENAKDKLDAKDT